MRTYAIILLAIFLVSCGSKSPETTLAEFYSYAGAEDQLLDPLILEGDKVVPLVMEKIQYKDMPRRRYAISFLGNGSYRESLPVLQQILGDKAEPDHFRCSALQSIFQIDVQLGTTYAEKFQVENDCLGEMAKAILAKDTWIDRRRSYLDAWLGLHD